MEKHAVSCHSGEKRPTFGMKVVKTHSSARSRQIHEAVRIRRKAKTSTILNSKSEYSRCRLPRLVVETWKEKEIFENASTENNTFWLDRDSIRCKRKLSMTDLEKGRESDGMKGIETTRYGERRLKRTQ